MKKSMALLVGVALFTAAAWAQPSVLVSMGTRETGTSAEIGGNGGTANGIEWVNLDGQTLVLDGTWQLFTFDMDTDPITPFAGGSANGVLGDINGDGVPDVFTGTIEHIRFRFVDYFQPITLWIDDVADTIDPPGPPPPTTITFGTFEGYADGTEVMFQEPGFSGSTSGFQDPAFPDISAIDNTVAHSGTGSLRVEFDWLDTADPTFWLRLTTYGTNQPQPNPAIRYDQDSVVSFWIRGIPEPTTLLLLGVPGLALLRRR